MAILGQIGGGAYCLVAFVIGIRLLGLSARTRQLPELLIGMSVLLLAGVGYPLSAAARQAPGLADTTRVMLGATAGVLASVGLVANTAFTWTLFRRGTGWANALFAGITGATLALLLAQSVGGGWAQGERFWNSLPILIALSYGWAFLECSRYHLLLRRRLRLGMAEPVVTNRFALYAAATGLALVTNLVGYVFWMTHVEMLTSPLGGPVLLVLGTGSSALMMLAFLPPRAYLAWVRTRAPEVA